MAEPTPRPKPVPQLDPALENLAKFLQESGLLFEINRLVLHPRGLALGVEVELGESAMPTFLNPRLRLLDGRASAGGGMHCSERSFQSSRAKLSVYDATQDQGKRVAARQKLLGFIIQDADSDLPPEPGAG